MRPADAFPHAKGRCSKSALLDNSLSEAHTSLGICLLQYEWDWAGAEREFSRSIELNGENVVARLNYSILLAAVGRKDESLSEAEARHRARPVVGDDPDEIWASSTSSRGNTAGMHSRLQKALEIDPGYANSYGMLAFAHQAKGELTEALNWLERATAITPMFTVRGWAYGLAGRTNEVSRMVKAWSNCPRVLRVALAFVTITTGSGDVEAWRRRCGRATEDRSNGLVMAGSADFRCLAFRSHLPGHRS